jgi:hypothetical protein
MKKDLPENNVKDIAIAVALESESVESKVWYVYLINLKNEQTFGLNNEYWLSYYIGQDIFDKKFIFLPESIVEMNFIRIPVLNKPGVMIK